MKRKIEPLLQYPCKRFAPNLLMEPGREEGMLYQKGYFKQTLDILIQTVVIDSNFTRAFSPELTALRLRAVLFFEIGNYAASLKDLTQLLQIQPDNCQALATRALIFYTLKQYHQAWNDSDKAMSLNNRSIEVLLGRAAMYKNQGSLDSALEYLTQLLDDEPHHIKALVLRGDIYSQQQHFDLASRDFNAVVTIPAATLGDIKDKISCHLYLGQHQEALNSVNLLIEQFPESSCFYQTRSAIYAAQGSDDLVLKDLNTACNLEPDNTDVFNKRVKLLFKLNYYDLAVDDFKHLLTFVNADKACIYEFRARCYIQLRQFDLALQDLKQLHGLKPGYIPALKLKTELFLAEENDAKAHNSIIELLCLNPDDIWALLIRSQIHFRQGFFEAALKDLNKILTLDPQHVSALVLRCKLHGTDNNLELELQDLDTLLMLEPQNLWALKRRVAYLIQQGQLNLAFNDLLQLTILDSQDLNIRQQFIKLCIEIEKFGLALAYLEPMISTDSQAEWAILHSSMIYIKQNELNLALDTINSLNFDSNKNAAILSLRAEIYQLQNNPEAALEDLRSAFTLLVENDDLDRAYAVIEKILILKPEDLNILEERADIGIHLNKIDSVINDYNHILTVDPDRLPILYMRAFLCMYYLHDPKQALTDLDRLLVLGPNNSRALFERAAIYYLQNNKEGAEEDLEYLLSHDSKHVPALELLASLYLEQGYALKFLKTIQKLLAFEPDHFNANVSLINFCINSHRLSFALTRINKMLDLYPDNAIILTYRGMLYNEQGMADLALQDLNRSLELDAKSLNTLVFRAQTYIQINQFKHAMDDLDAVFKLEPNQIDATAVRGELYRCMNKDDLARADLNSVLQKQPFYQPALKSLGDLNWQNCQWQAALDEYEQLNLPSESILKKMAQAYRIVGNEKQAIIAEYKAYNSALGNHHLKSSVSTLENLCKWGIFRNKSIIAQIPQKLNKVLPIVLAQNHINSETILAMDSAYDQSDVKDLDIMNTFFSRF